MTATTITGPVEEEILRVLNAISSFFNAKIIRIRVISLFINMKSYQKELRRLVCLIFGKICTLPKKSAL